ncbi:KN motif and ankyrin repeat domain-containing protein 1 [Frankliniella fusca]|uniref:KN motif and ankyrin repeat domain-containing protein 1 n=1 Tax=Frankliniella fusca TaxID=407009 RepID=A0AAE1H018_9NEOP|nr:KN motif and ankyrin repeat domain-containing protein 1 [Frankliniella fusca]
MENFCGSKPPEGGCGSRQAQGFYPLWQPTASVFHGNRRFADCDPIAQFDRFDPRTTIGLPLEYIILLLLCHLIRSEPSKEMRAALKVLDDHLQLRQTPPSARAGSVPQELRNAFSIVQLEWFKVSSTKSADPLEVEDYLDYFEYKSTPLLEYVINMTDNSGNTAMHYAVSHGNFDVVSVLLDSKVCNVDVINTAGYASVMLVSLAQVCTETHRHVVRRLFHLADVNQRAKQHGQTALMLAVSHGRLDTVRLLLEAGADVNIQDEDGSTALMCAAEHGHLDIIKLLLAQPDCDVTVVDHDGSTALSIAMEAGHRDIGVLLYAHEHFSPGSSPYNSLKRRRARSVTPTAATRPLSGQGLPGGAGAGAAATRSTPPPVRRAATTLGNTHSHRSKP